MDSASTSGTSCRALREPCATASRENGALALSSVRRLRRPPSNVVVRRQGALAYLRALPCQTPRLTCIYADPPYIFPGRSMNYFGTKGRGHNLAFHLELRDTLFASGLPFVVSVNDVPEAWELYSRAEQLQARAHRGNPVTSAGLWGQPCCLHRIAGLMARTRPPHQALTILSELTRPNMRRNCIQRICINSLAQNEGKLDFRDTTTRQQAIERVPHQPESHSTILHQLTRPKMRGNCI